LIFEQSRILFVHNKVTISLDSGIKCYLQIHKSHCHIDNTVIPPFILFVTIPNIIDKSDFVDIVAIQIVKLIMTLNKLLSYQSFEIFENHRKFRISTTIT
jgi:hypothetical protein